MYTVYFNCISIYFLLCTPRVGSYIFPDYTYSYVFSALFILLLLRCLPPIPSISSITIVIFMN